jgi:hypothetical protein
VDTGFSENRLPASSGCTTQKTTVRTTSKKTGELGKENVLIKPYSRCIAATYE